jgi:hypothetical protein
MQILCHLEVSLDGGLARAKATLITGQLDHGFVTGYFALALLVRRKSPHPRQWLRGIRSICQLRGLAQWGFRHSTYPCSALKTGWDCVVMLFKYKLNA